MKASAGWEARLSWFRTSDSALVGARVSETVLARYEFAHVGRKIILSKVGFYFRGWPYVRLRTEIGAFFGKKYVVLRILCHGIYHKI